MTSLYPQLPCVFSKEAITKTRAIYLRGSNHSRNVGKNFFSAIKYCAMRLASVDTLRIMARSIGNDRKIHLAFIKNARKRLTVGFGMYDFSACMILFSIYVI